ncbi:hypothetical protein ABZ297_14140 [Nonomuraea sp. NPDC005983]|uniref:hypothetical protein n=1 Tax=Nonomuraea sp. NPDC005983 TaxID=3155595 RepID=UPI0033BCA54E
MIRRATATGTGSTRVTCAPRARRWARMLRTRWAGARYLGGLDTRPGVDAQDDLIAIGLL